MVRGKRGVSGGIDDPILVPSAHSEGELENWKTPSPPRQGRKQRKVVDIDSILNQETEDQEVGDLSEIWRH